MGGIANGLSVGRLRRILKSMSGYGRVGAQRISVNLLRRDAERSIDFTDYAIQCLKKRWEIH